MGHRLLLTKVLIENAGLLLDLFSEPNVELQHGL